MIRIKQTTPKQENFLKTYRLTVKPLSILLLSVRLNTLLDVCVKS